MHEYLGWRTGNLEDMVSDLGIYMSKVRNSCTEDQKILFLLRGLPEKYRTVLMQKRVSGNFGLANIISWIENDVRNKCPPQAKMEEWMSWKPDGFTVLDLKIGGQLGFLEPGNFQFRQTSW